MTAQSGTPTAQLLTDFYHLIDGELVGGDSDACLDVINQYRARLGRSRLKPMKGVT